MIAIPVDTDVTPYVMMVVAQSQSAKPDAVPADPPPKDEPKKKKKKKDDGTDTDDGVPADSPPGKDEGVPADPPPKN